MAVVVNYRTAALTIRAVRSLYDSTARPAAVIVVDNGSGDGSASRIAAAVPEVHVIEESENRGFSAGCNAGIRVGLARGAARILIFNGDAHASKTALRELEQVLESAEDIGIVGPIVVSMTPAGQVESAGIRYSPRTGRMRNIGFGRQLTAIEHHRRRDVDAVSGCAMLVKRTVFECVGLFDEDYFFGFEDIDFCLRARTRDFQCVVAGAALVEHDGQASIGKQSADRMYFATRNHLRLAERNASGPWIARCLRLGSVLTLNLARALTTTEIARIPALRGFARGARDYVKNIAAAKS